MLASRNPSCEMALAVDQSIPGSMCDIYTTALRSLATRSKLQPVPSQLSILKQGRSRATLSKGGKEGEKNGVKQDGGGGMVGGASGPTQT